MKGVNQVVLLGRLGNDPELKSVGSGSQVATFSLATSQVWTDKSGQKQEKTEWHRVVVWNKLAEVASKYLNKGSSCFVRGRLSTRSWTTEGGEKRYSTEIVAEDIQFMSSGRGGEDSGETKGGRKSQNSSQQNNYDYDNDEPDFDPGEDIPF